MTTNYALIGTGSRAKMYLDSIATTHRDTARLVGLADTNVGRLGHYESELRSAGVEPPPRFDCGELGAAIGERNVDRVIITTPDATHASYIVEALEAGADVIVEKPLAVSESDVADIAAAVERTGGEVIVTFNYRYSPRNSALREIIASGRLGQVTSVHFEWLLDTAHGADYFRRWHRLKHVSGGLLVHKASHHFDLVNWWLDDVPTRVYASGGLRFYGADNARARGLGERPDRGTTDSAFKDAFSLDMRRDDELKALYLDNEHHDGYRRDQDVFEDGITIEDNMSVVVDYAKGASMSYTLSAHGPWEGYTVAVNGTKGRAELTVVERGAVLLDEDGAVAVDPSAAPDRVVADQFRPIDEQLVFQEQFGPAQVVEIPEGAGGHGGGDAILLDDLFIGAGDDPLRRAASWKDGVRSIMVGIGGNKSLATGLPVTLSDLEFGPYHSMDPALA